MSDRSDNRFNYRLPEAENGGRVLKRALLVFVSVLLLAFGGCTSGGQGGGDKDSAPVLPQSYTADLVIDYNGKVSQAKYVQRSLGDCEIEFTEPVAIKGLKIAYKGTTCTLSYAGLKFDADLSSFPESNLGKMMIEAFKSAAQDTTVKKTRSGDRWKYEGETSEKKFLIMQNAETGFFESFEMPAYNLKIELKNIKAQ